MIARRFAAMLAAVIMLLATNGLALAQSQPQAAPTGPSTQTQQLGSPAAAPTTPVDVTQTGGFGGPQINGINIYDLFLRADPIVKSVMGLLVFSSLWSWAIIFNKWIALGSLGRRAD